MSGDRDCQENTVNRLCYARENNRFHAGFVSVIISVYNAEARLERMLQSIQEQSYKHFEVILVNDGSTDFSEDICRKFERMDSRFCCYSQSNQGVSAARNHGLEHATGEFVTFLDADDWIDANYLQVLLSACKDADIAICDTVVEIEEKEVLRFTHKETVMTQAEALNELLTRKTINSGPYSKIFRKKIIKGIKFKKYKTYEDILFCIDAFTQAESIAVTDRTRYHYVQNPSGAMSYMLKEPSLDIINATDRIMDFLIQRPDLKQGCCYTTVSHLLQYAMPLATERQFHECEFLTKTRLLYKKYMGDILCCDAIPWKERVVLWLFSRGWIYSGRKLNRISKGK